MPVNDFFPLLGFSGPLEKLFYFPREGERVGMLSAWPPARWEWRRGRGWVAKGQRAALLSSLGFPPCILSLPLRLCTRLLVWRPAAFRSVPFLPVQQKILRCGLAFEKSSGVGVKHADFRPSHVYPIPRF